MAEHGLTARRRRLLARSDLADKAVTLGLLLVLLLAAVTGMTSALKGPDLAVLWLGLLCGLLLGWGLAILRQPAYWAAGIVVAAGLLFLVLVPGGLGGRIAALAAESVHRMLVILPFYRGPAGDPGRLARLVQDLAASLQVIAGRVQVWTAALLGGKPAFDPVAAALAWNALVWAVAAWAGWIVEARRNALLAVSPALLLSLTTLSTGLRTSTSLYLMLGVTLLVLALSGQDQRRRGWEAGRVAYPSGKGRQILNAALLGTVALVFFSALLPSLSVQRIHRWIDALRKPAPPQQSRLAQSLGILPGGTPAPDAFRAVRSPGLPRDHLIGAGPELSGRVVMTVRASDLAALAAGGQPLPLYWRGFTYDVYTGQGWSSSDTAEDPVPADQPLQAGQARGYLLIRQDVSPAEDLGGTVYAAGEPVQLNLASQVAWRASGDLFGVRIESSQAYEILSLVPVLDEQALRTAGERYPDWIRRRYLSLPDEVPERVKALALRLTASQPTPFDRAKAIESYLRTFPYTLDVSRPPLDRDVVDYFLFDLKKGYCDYYASAMVVLARAAGIPARLAVGYAPGTYNLNSKRFVVTEADAHSWAEVYFPGLGWVPFEPTAARPALERSEAVAPETTPSAGLPAPTQASGGANLLPLGGRALLGLLALAGVIAATWTAADAFRLRRLAAGPAATEIYRRLRRYGQRLAVSSQPGDTPYEFGQALRGRLRDLAGGVKRRPLGAQLGEASEALIDGIVRVSYRPSPEKDFRLLEKWRRLQTGLDLVWLLTVWRSLAAPAGRRSPELAKRDGFKENRPQE